MCGHHNVGVPPAPSDERGVSPSLDHPVPVDTVSDGVAPLLAPDSPRTDSEAGFRCTRQRSAVRTSWISVLQGNLLALS